MADFMKLCVNSMSHRLLFGDVLLSGDLSSGLQSAPPFGSLIRGLFYIIIIMCLTLILLNHINKRQRNLKLYFTLQPTKEDLALQPHEGE